jgi:hypothetical protein
MLIFYGFSVRWRGFHDTRGARGNEAYDVLFYVVMLLLLLLLSCCCCCCWG